MTKRDFFRVLIRIFALYSIILTVFSWIPSNLMYSSFEYEFILILGAGLFFTLLSIIFYVFLVRKTDAIIDFLKIDKGFDDSKIELSDFDSDKVFMLGIILIGGFLFVTEFSYFIEFAFITFKREIQSGELYVFFNGFDNSENSLIDGVFSGLNLIIGYLLLTNHQRIAKWITKKGKVAQQ